MDQIDKEELLRKRDELTPWLTSIYLGQGVWSRSPETVNPAKVNWYMDTMELFLGGLKGKRVLDIGIGCGDVVYQSEKHCKQSSKKKK
jgi:2-polyprenyl-3-methyl-5-hydroxy-6-metoxy-1,4-benzoquinol methylase